MKILADSNLIVSAFATRGLSDDGFQPGLDEHLLMTGDFVLNELARVLTEKLNVPERNVRDAEDLLRQHHIEPLPNQPSEYQFRDEDDRWVRLFGRYMLE